MGRSAKVMDTVAIVASDAERLAQYCPDLDNWPRSWSIEPRDLAPGQRLVDHLKPFLLHLLASGLSRKTLRIHRDNLWVLGGEMIRDFHQDPPLRKHSVDVWLDKVISDDGGPLIYHSASEEQQRSFDSTCRRLHRFLEHNARTLYNP